MIGIAFIAVLGAAEVTELGAPEAEPRIVVDLYPHSTTGALAVGGALGAIALHFPVSVTVAIGPATALHAQLAVTYVDHKNRAPGWGVSASVGPLFSFGASALRGFFLSPQFTFEISSATLPLAVTRTTNGPIDIGREWSRAFLAGLEVGYQWTWGSRHIAVMIGASAGYQYDGVTFVSELGLDRRSATPSGTRPQGFAFGVNANLFRIGFAL